MSIRHDDWHEGGGVDIRMYNACEMNMNETDNGGGSAHNSHHPGLL